MYINDVTEVNMMDMIDTIETHQTKKNKNGMIQIKKKTHIFQNHPATPKYPIIR